MGEHNRALCPGGGIEKCGEEGRETVKFWTYWATVELASGSEMWSAL